jgi:hypothetical protein
MLALEVGTNLSISKTKPTMNDGMPRAIEPENTTNKTTLIIVVIKLDPPIISLEAKTKPITAARSRDIKIPASGQAISIIGAFTFGLGLDI